MTILKTDTVSGIGTEGTVFDGDITFDSLNYMTLPKGTTTQSNAVSSGISSVTGAIRYNTDSNKMECFNGTQWMLVSVSNPDLNGGARGLFCGGAKDPSAGNPSTNAIDYVTIPTAGNATDFGDLTESKERPSACASKVRGYTLGGANHPTGTGYNTIEYVTFSSTGNGTDFGDLDTTTADDKSRMGGCNSATRGMCAGGKNTKDKMWYITMTTSGTGLDFGNLLSAIESPMACSSPTRALWAGGSDGSSNHQNVIQYITTASLGNAVDFGDLTVGRTSCGASSNSTRGIWPGGATPSVGKVIDYTTIATLGNAIRFGDLPTSVDIGNAACSSPVRVLISGGGTGPNAGLNVINYVTIATEGDAVDFGDRTNDEKRPGSMSNANGGL